MPENAGRRGRRRLLLVSTNYAPEPAGIAPYATQAAEHWAACGAFEVHVLAGMPHYPAWRTDPAYRGLWRTTEERGGVCVHRRRHTVPPVQTAARRALYEASILAHGLLAPPAMRPPHVVVAQLPSLAGGVLAARTARRHRVPFLPVVQDLMGSAAAQSGMRGGGRAAAAVAAAERHVLRQAALVGVIHDSFTDRVAALGVPRRRIRLVPNWAHVAPPRRPRAQVRARLGWDADETVVLHAGNMGLKQGLEVLVDAARLAAAPAAGAHRVRVVLMGDGSQRDRLRGLAAGVPGLEVLPPATEEDFTDVLAAADVLAVTQRASVRDMSVPSKLTSYLTAARPVVGSVAPDGGTAGELRRSGAAVLVPPEDPRALLDAVAALAADPARAARLSAAGQRYAAERLGRAAGLARLTALLDEALGTHRPAPRRTGTPEHTTGSRG